jgi:Bacterial RNA polymerase, alpha chain C terminal domain
MSSEVESLGVPITAVGLSVRTLKVCRKMGLVTLGDLTQVTPDELLRDKCFGRSNLHEVRGLLAEFGLALKGDPEPDRSQSETGPGAAKVKPFMWFKMFARDPRHHLSLPLWVLDLCPRTFEWLNGRQLGTVLELVDCTLDDLWLLALADDLSLEDAVHCVDDVEVRLRAFNLWLRPARPAHEVFRLPSGSPDDVAGYRLDEYRLRAETIFRLRLAGVGTLGDLKGRSAELSADLASWPPEPAGQARALLALLDEVPDPVPGWNDPADDLLSAASVT